MPLFLGQLVNNRYRIDNTLAQDETGVLYQAFDLHLNTSVAFLENLAAGEASRQRFSHEAAQLTRLSHANLPRILDHLDVPHQGQYLVMELVTGETFQQKLDAAGVISQTDGLNWIAQVSGALAYLHQQGEDAPHPSLALTDILVSDNGRIVLSGFDLLLRHLPGKTAAVAGITPGFSPPEAYGQNVGPETDERQLVYRLGAMLYYLLTNQTPPESIQLATGSAQLMPPSRLNPDVTPAVEQLIMKAMAPDPARRFASLETLRHQLLSPSPAAEAAPAGAAPAAAGQPTGRMWLVLMGLSGLGFLLGATLVSVAYFSFVDTGDNPVAAAATPRSLPTRPPVTVDGGETPAAALVDFPTPTVEPLTIEVAEDSELNLTPSQSGPNAPIEVVEDPQSGVVMVKVPAGPFIMGGPGGGADSVPAHKVVLGDYYIDQFEVTNAQYRACVEAEVCQPPASNASYTRQNYFTNNQFDDHPVLQVSWEQAFAFCGWREARLPTEAEWEKAARGADERTYPWGEGIDCSMANWATSSGTCVGDTTATGSYPDGASAFGAHDMAGNVWEWVADWYAEEYYAESPGENPRGPETGDLKVLRGGSWVSNESNVRVVFRNNLEPASTSSNIGFRCARPAPP
jgi:formylglycine-generating enzyme required for sulfatase activity